jgi:transcriptional regulator with XRE-family HTH domain
MMELKEAFGIALRSMRLRQRLTQEDFGDVSSRTYISMLERGVKNATIEKVAELAGRLEVHPLSLLVETFMTLDPEADLELLFERVRSELAHHPAQL